MLLLRLMSKINGKYVKTFYIEDTLVFSKAFIDVLKLFENKSNYALRLDFTLNNNRKFSLWITKDYKAVLISQKSLNTYGILNLNTIRSYMPLIIDVFTLTRSDYLANIEVLNYMQKLYDINVLSLTPFEMENYREKILREINKIRGVKKPKEYSISDDLTKILCDVIGLSRIILYRSNICNITLQVPIREMMSIRDIVNEIIRNVETTIARIDYSRKREEILAYVHVKLRKYVIRMLIDVHKRHYGITINVGNKPIDLKEIFEEPIGKYLNKEHGNLEVAIKCIPDRILSKF